LFLSARDADDGGGFAGPSYYWSHCKSLLHVGDDHVTRRSLADQVYPVAQAPSLRQYLRTCASGRLAPHAACGIGSFEPPAWRRWGGLAGLRSSVVLQELAGTGSFSPSALESYLKCPFAWFIERVVGAEEMETQVDNGLAGDLLHRVMRDTFRELKVKEALPLRAENLREANDIAAGIIERAVQGDDFPGTPAERRVLEWRVKRWAGDMFVMEVAADSALRTLETEYAFGGADGIDVDGLALRGRIDRIDHTAAGDLFVIDYKSGALAAKSKIGTKEALQMPLYMLALGRERPDVQVLGGAYLSPKERKRSGVIAAGYEDLLGAQSGGHTIADEGAFRELLDGSLELAKQAAQGIRNGDISPLHARECPGWCRLGPVCRAKKGSGAW
jgi:ATP-dependent helicase/DNAse subunit B